LDNLEAGSRDRTLDQGQKRLLSSTGARLLRLWRIVLREGGSREYLRSGVVSKDCSLQLEASDRRRFRMEGDLPDAIEEKARDGMVRQLRQNLARCRRVIVDQNMDLKTRERWTQLYNNTSQVLNQILKDRQMRDWEKRLREIEKFRGIQKRTVQSETDPPDSKTTNPEQ
jgi:hypothetical protein